MKRNIVMAMLLILTSGCTTARLVKRTPYTGNTIYAAFGDCISEGAGADPLSNCFASLTTDYLNKLHPTITLVKYGEGGSTTQSYVTYLPIFLSKLPATNPQPLARATLLIGLNDLLTIYDGCDSCTSNGPYDRGLRSVTYYKKEIQSLIDDVMKYNPNCNLVLCTVPDPSNDGKGTFGPFKPAGLIKEFNKKIHELGDANGLPVADLYKVMMGHPEWFVNGDIHPNTDGHAVMAWVIESAFEPDTKIPMPAVMLKAKK
jgi:lysophospholipase L1-like esterase